MDDLRAIRTFLKVAEMRSFAGAARALGRTPTAVTRAVSALEDSLGTQLLVRTTRSVALTSAGAVYAARVAPLVAGLADAAGALREEAGSLAGTIRLNAPQSLGVLVLPRVLTGFRDAYPGVSVSVTLTDRFVDILQEDCDLAVRISAPPRDKSTIWRKICHVERLLVAAPGHRAVTVQQPEDLRPEECLGYGTDPGGEAWDLTGETRAVGLRAGRALASNSGDLLARMAEKGAGVALLPRFIVDDAMQEGRLVQVLPGWRPPDIWLTLYYPPYDVLPARVATFSDHFERYVIERTPVPGARVRNRAGLISLKDPARGHA
jgi:DNA-binding transcriptional LysR family regulator